MKKAVLIILSAIVLFASSFGISYAVMKNMNKKTPAVSGNMGPYPSDTVFVTISAVGDCTLGSDTAFGVGGSFPLELQNNDGDYSYFLSKVRPYFEDDDITIVNLEGPLSRGGIRADKKYAFRGDPDYVNILSLSSVEAANIANNHTLDYGKDAYEDTKKYLSEGGVTPFGCDTIAIVDIKGIKVGLIGTSALSSADRVNYPKMFEQLKGEKPDLIIASFHWGVEKSVSPNADQITLAHNAIDNGADLVIGHHPHVLQGIEKYKGKYIVYSLGNFCFGGNKSPVDRDTMIFSQTFTFYKGERTDEENVNIVPCFVSSVKDRNNYQPIPATGEDFKRIRKKIVNLSANFEGVENINFVEGDK